MSSHEAAVIHLLDTELAVSGQFYRASTPPVPSNVMFPYITVQEAIGVESMNLVNSSGLNRKVMQICVWDKSHEVAWELRESIKSLLLTPYKGSAGDHVIQGVDTPVEKTLYDSIRYLHQLILQITIWFESSL